MSAAAPGYPASATQRWVPEPDKRPGRTAFQRDRARVLHSAALRRLAGTTQVVAPGETDFPRTRLTHSLECGQVGRELGAAFGCDADLVETACLAHDLGHPPFGHNGEQVLDAFAADHGGFEGNAQSLRILTRLDPKRFAPGRGHAQDSTVHSPEPGRGVGLNLTRATLDAATKYPWPRGHPAAIQDPTKYGVYPEDEAVFGWLRQGAPPAVPCFEAQVMDWADDVAYSVHDLEDALHAGHVHPATLRTPEHRDELLALAAEWYAPGVDEAELGAALDRLLALDYWPHQYDGTATEQAALKDATSQLIGRFCQAAEQATRARHGHGPLTRYHADLTVPRASRHECAVLKAVAVRYVLLRPDQQRLRARQRELLAELAEALRSSAPCGLGPLYRELFDAAPDDHTRTRVIVDQLASLTDASARQLHARLLRPGRD